MSNETQLDRYKKLIFFVNENFKKEISIPDIEKNCNYSYRNINRIFEAINHETIGKYIKRIRLDKGAEYLKYSDKSISDIALDIGYSDVAAFSKAFKNRFSCSPSSFRENKHINYRIAAVPPSINMNESPQHKLKFEVERLPDFEILGLDYKGSYEDAVSVDKKWDQLLNYANTKGLINENTIYLTEVLDDDGITEQINCRITVAIVLEEPLDFEPEGLILTKTISSGNYIKFIHNGSHETCVDTYTEIYCRWLHDIQYEMRDASTIEFYLNDIDDTPKDELITEIYVPII